MTHDLIERLVADLKPVPRTGMRWRITLRVAAGIAISAVLMLLTLGLRPDLASALATPIFWIKFAYTLGLGLSGIWATNRLGRPGTSAKAPMLAAAAVAAVVVIPAAIDYSTAGQATRGAILFGQTYLQCPLLVMGLSLPLLLAGLLVIRRLAPTRLTMAGAAVGLMAGALAAWVYSFHCDEVGLPFLASWYSLGIVAITALGPQRSTL